ncbi:hypothetical protein AGMMS50262_13890 [Bacteroidia bacterium]|nr:hypothetical protein AGMMS50262_13890 [Bacteroidia bacterium]
MFDLLLKLKLKRFYRDETREKRFLNLRNIHTILVLFDTSDYDEADAFIEKLERLGKQITGYAYLPKSDRYDYSETPYHIVTHKDNLNSIAGELEKESFDLVIDLTLKRNLPLEYLLVHANAPVKTGLKKNATSPYDLAIISLPDIQEKNLKIRELGKQIIYYLYIIQTRPIQ